MKKHIFPIIFLTILGTMACQKEEIDPSINPVSEGYLVFGQVGLGWGCRASVMYMITDGNLFADTSNVFCKNQGEYSFSGYLLPKSEYDKAKNLISQFPTELSKEGGKTFGCPGCADGGMLYIQRFKRGEKTQSWRIDETIFYSNNDVTGKPFPSYLLPYGKAFGKIIPEIKYK
jgi:hypothetical protein